MKKRKTKKQADIDVSESIDVVGDAVNKNVKEVKREWREFLKFGDENRLLFASFVIVMTALVVVNTMYVITNGRRTQQNITNGAVTVPDPNLVLSTLRTGYNSAFKAKISSVTEIDKTDYAFTISPYDTMLIMTVNVTNLSHHTQHLIPVNQFYVRSNEGDYAALHASMYVTNPLPSTDLAPGKSASGQISFDVPKRVAQPLVYVDLGWENNAPLVFDVLH